MYTDPCRELVLFNLLPSRLKAGKVFSAIAVVPTLQVQRAESFFPMLYEFVLGYLSAYRSSGGWPGLLHF